VLWGILVLVSCSSEGSKSFESSFHTFLIPWVSELVLSSLILEPKDKHG
jgi:hypothetical protein